MTRMSAEPAEGQEAEIIQEEITPQKKGLFQKKQKKGFYCFRRVLKLHAWAASTRSATTLRCYIRDTGNTGTRRRDTQYYIYIYIYTEIIRGAKPLKLRIYGDEKYGPPTVLYIYDIREYGVLPSDRI